MSGQQVRHGEVRVYRMRDLNQHTAGVLKDINDSGRPAFITRHGRFVAMITPLEGQNIEGRLIAALLDEQAQGSPGATESLPTDALASRLGINLPS
ncbi:type II toxin-antitoxin system Phd/YefM family antitoxin [Kribbella shirazensis]|uniref:Antitoxin (DNA-binding transcriptional repressor) of toxin-antitoxin stability system n=1 Tax=Kribbella shirazensis TaxID=1105143 RepID=A0A7X5V8Y4_9ACTN|nr:type II toxin-antitoxin system Phd/YefM family antitoxin [Kribbella shirazensis]NIK56831.1 antitoxin (DNA-binding transcriptional repressor) of toxin-antitoxin stability system [Kribbella shirazensis]